MRIQVDELPVLFYNEQKEKGFVMYIYEQKDWPHFYYDKESVNLILQSLIYQQGKLAAQIQSLGFVQLQDSRIDIMTQDVLRTSMIEGEKFEENEIRSSIARKLGLPFEMYKSSNRNCEGIVQVALDATLNSEKALTKELLCEWHKLLFPMGYSGFFKIEVGDYRTDRSGKMQVVSGLMGREKVHFEAPQTIKLEKEMSCFLKWYNEDTSVSYFIRAAIAHLWFVTIHPFDDGNGRIARALTDMLLARAEEKQQRFYSLSSAIFDQRRAYYDALEDAQKGALDITQWVLWFLNCVKMAIEKNYQIVRQSLKKEEIWKALRNVSFNARQIKILNKLLEGFEGKLTTTKYAKMNKCSQDTAYRDLLMLIEHGIVQKSDVQGRNTYYFLDESFLK